MELKELAEGAIEDIRSAIAREDIALFDALRRRAALVKALDVAKRVAGAPTYSPKREEFLVRRFDAYGDEVATECYMEVIRVCRESQQRRSEQAAVPPADDGGSAGDRP